MADPYRTLGVAQDASPADIRSAYKRAVLECHPDRQNATSSRTMVEVQRAYESITANKGDSVEPDAALARWFARQGNKRSEVNVSVVDDTYMGSVSGLTEVNAPAPTWNHRDLSGNVANAYDGQAVEFDVDAMQW